MVVIVWSVLALVLVLGTAVAASLLGRRIAPPPSVPPGERAPVSSLERLVRWCLAFGLPLMAAIVVVVAWSGPTTYDDEVLVRLTVTALYLAGMIVLAAPTLIAGIWMARDDGRLDERDRAILGRAPAGQAAAMLVVLVVWNIALHESFRGQAGVPAVFLDLIFWSCLLVSLLASNVGILIGYRRP